MAKKKRLKKGMQNASGHEVRVGGSKRPICSILFAAFDGQKLGKFPKGM